MDLNDTHIGYWYWWDGKVDPRSRSQGQRSRSHMNLCKHLLSAINHNWMIVSWGYLDIWLNWWYLKVEPRSRSQNQRSRSHTHLRKIIVLAITHERMIGSWWYLDIYDWYCWDVKVDSNARSHLAAKHFWKYEMCICDKQARLTYLRGVNVLVIWNH